MTSDTPDGIFLLHEDNAAYLAGQDRHPDSLTATNYLYRFLIMVLLCVVGLVMLGVGLFAYRDYATLRDDGLIAEGALINRDIYRGKSITYSLVYQFEVREGRHMGSYRGEQKVGKGKYNSVEVGDVVSILYDPNDPTLSRMADLNTSPIALIVIGGAIVFLGLMLGRAGFRNRKENELLAQEGKILYGAIATCSGIRERSSYIINVSYSFISPETGEKIRGRMFKTRNDLRGKPLPEPGTPVAILYRNDEHHEML
jgi:hypothetical protein